jgi:hypothetical protein
VGRIENVLLDGLDGTDSTVGVCRVFSVKYCKSYWPAPLNTRKYSGLRRQQVVYEAEKGWLCTIKTILDLMLDSWE